MAASDPPAATDGSLPSSGRLAYELDAVEAHLASLRAERARLVQAIASAEARLEVLRHEQEAREEAERAEVSRLAADAQARIARIERDFNAAAEALRLAAANDAAQMIADARRVAALHATAEGRG